MRTWSMSTYPTWGFSSAKSTETDWNEATAMGETLGAKAKHSEAALFRWRQGKDQNSLRGLLLWYILGLPNYISRKKWSPTAETRLCTEAQRRAKRSVGGQKEDSPASPHLEGEAGMRAYDSEHQCVAEDVHHQVPRRSHSIGAAHVLRRARLAAVGSDGTGGEMMQHPHRWTSAEKPRKSSANIRGTTGSSGNREKRRSAPAVILFRNDQTQKTRPECCDAYKLRSRYITILHLSAAPRPSLQL